MSDAVFPYGIAFREGGAVELFPAARLLVRAQGGEWLSLFFLIDSGAMVSALPRTDAKSLGVGEVERGIPLRLGGIGGEEIRGWRHQLTARLGGAAIIFPVVFLDASSAPRVLGREGIFERFTIIFEERRRRTALLKRGIPASRSVSNILDQLEA